MKTSMISAAILLAAGLALAGEEKLPEPQREMIILTRGYERTVHPGQAYLGGAMRNLKTSLRFRWDGQGLSASVDCVDPSVVAAQGNGRDAADAWKDDCVELLLDPGHEHGVPILVRLSAAGALWDGRGADAGYDIDGLQARVERTASGWSGRLEIPWSGLGMKAPADGALWGVNLRRLDHAGAFSFKGAVEGSWMPANGTESQDPLQSGHLAFLSPESTWDDARLADLRRHLEEDHARAIRAWAGPDDGDRITLGGGAVALANLGRITSGTPARQATRVTVDRDAEALIVRFDCEDSDVSAVQKDRDHPKLWKDDCVYVWLDPDHDHQGMIMVQVSAAGIVHDSKAGDMKWNLEGLAAEVKRTERGWTAMLRLPFKGLGVEAPGAGGLWGFNLSRMDQPGEYDYQRMQVSSLATIPGGDLGRMQRWGHLAFGQAADPAQAPAHVALKKAVDERIARIPAALKLFKSNDERIPEGLAEYGVADWDRKLGNHRAVVRVGAPADIVCAYLPWRRRDAHPEAKHVQVMDARTGEVVSNVVVASCNREYGEILFQPTGGAGEYHIYYLMPGEDRFAPHWPRASFPVVSYKRPQHRPEPAWLHKHSLTREALESTHDPNTATMTELNDGPGKRKVHPAPWRELPLCDVMAFQSRGERHSFFPMELVATLDELDALERRFRFQPFILFPELRTRPIRMTDEIPYRWAVRGESALTGLQDQVMRNEYYVFQVGVYASKNLLKDLSVRCSDLASATGARIPAKALTCFNLEGVDPRGNAFTKTVDVEYRKIQALWFGLDVPQDAAPGLYEGTLTVGAAGGASQTLRLSLAVKEAVLADRGDGDPWRLSRLRWLNSRIAVDDDVCAPFTSIVAGESEVDILGRRVELDRNGLPRQVTSFIDMFAIREKGREVLRAPARFEVIVNGEVVKAEGAVLKRSHASPGVARYTSTSRAGKLAIRVETTVEMDGFVSHVFVLEAGEPVRVDGLRFTLPFFEQTSRYAMHLADTSTDQISSDADFGLTRDEAWGYGVENFELLWLGAHNAGLCLRVPPGETAWINGGQGRVQRVRNGAGRDIILDSGPMVLEGTTRLAVELYATPFKPLTPAFWNQRHYHGGELDIRKGQASGANIFTYHHGTPSHPYISYPFLVAETLRKRADVIHAGGGRMKLYYTVRELSDRAPELWALRSLGHEILVGVDAKRGYPDYQLGYDKLSQLPLEYQLRNDYAWPFTGSAWMCEHLVSDYQPRWHQPVDLGDRLVVDGSLQVSGTTRWSNFYLEGLRWLMLNAGLDGLYLDGITFDRESFKRVRKTLVRTKPEGLIDYHSHPTAIAQMPYFDRLWNGEMANYNREPEYWLVAVSGVPFGVGGELLKGDASVQRGMVFGLSQRHGWMPEQANPSGLWKWWDDFDIARSEMLGFWQETCPVKTGNDQIKATAYVHKGRKVAIAVASWATAPVTVKLDLDWAAVGLDPARATLAIPEIPFFQAAQAKMSLDAVAIEPGKGWILVVEGDDKR